MDIQQKPTGHGLWADAPPEMSRFSVRRYSIQHFLLLLLVNCLLPALTVAAFFAGHPFLLGLSAMTMVVVWIKTALVIWAGLSTVEVESWIRRLGMGDFDYRIEPRGNDEIDKACESLESLRLRSIEVVRLRLVEELSTQLA